MINQLFQIDSIFRVFFTLTAILFGAGLCIKAWKDYQVNYLYILQTDYVTSYIQFFKLSLIYLFIQLLFLYFFLKKIDFIFVKKELINKDSSSVSFTTEEMEEIKEYKRMIAIIMVILFAILWFNPIKGLM